MVKQFSLPNRCSIKQYTALIYRFFKWLRDHTYTHSHPPWVHKYKKTFANAMAWIVFMRSLFVIDFRNYKIGTSHCYWRKCTTSHNFLEVFFLSFIVFGCIWWHPDYQYKIHTLTTLWIWAMKKIDRPFAFYWSCKSFAFKWQKLKLELNWKWESKMHWHCDKNINNIEYWK